MKYRPLNEFRREGAHAHRLHRRRPGRSLFRPADEEAASGARRRGRRAQPALRHVRLGRRVLGRDPGGDDNLGRGDRRGDPERPESLGRHRASVQGAPHPHDRSRLRRDRAQEAAQHSAGALRGARRAARFRARGEFGSRVPGRRSGRRLGRRVLAAARALQGSLSARFRGPAEPVHLARHAQAVRRLHLRLPEDGARLVPGAHLQVRRQDLDLHRRDDRAGLRGAPARPAGSGRLHRVLRESLRRNARRRRP